MNALIFFITSNFLK